MYTRRTCALSLLCIAVSSLGATVCFSAPSDKINIQLTIAAKDEYQFPPAAQFDGKRDTEQSKGLPVIITVALGVVLVSYLADLILDIYDRMTNGTLVVDVRNNQVDVHNIPGATDELIVVSDSGIQHFARSDISRDVVNLFLEKALGTKLQ